MKKLPYLVAKIAISLDGKIAMSSGESQWITSKEARDYSHTLRRQFDAIAVGKNTLNQDNPKLTDRISEKPTNPIRIVFSSSGDINFNSHFVTNLETESILISGASMRPRIKKKIQKTNIQLIQSGTEFPDIKWSLSKLEARGIQSILVEGGEKFISSLIQDQILNAIYVFVSGKIIGDNKAPTWVNRLGFNNLSQVPNCAFETVSKIGEDVLIFGKIHY